MRPYILPRPAFIAALFALLSLALCGPLRAATAIQEVRSPGGITAWLVEDHSLPLISIRFAFRGGTTQDPAGKEGLVNLMSTLFDEGAGDLDSDAFQRRLDETGAEMGFDAGRDRFYGSMRLLSDRREGSLDLLKLAVQAPRFDPAAVERMRAQILVGIRADATDPRHLARQEWAKALYGDHAYARDGDGTEAGLSAVGPADLKAAWRAMFARDNLTVGVVGDIDAAELGKVLDEVFGGLPDKAALVPVADVSPRLDQTVPYVYDLPQTTLQLVYPGLPRKAPDYFAAYLMTEILGGGDSSRLFEEVRKKRGLAYGIGAMLLARDHSDTLAISTATRADRAGDTLALIRDVVKAMREEGPTQAELAAVKKNVIGSYAIANLGSSRAIATTLVELQLADLGIDYLDRRAGLIDAVTLDEVKEAAGKLLSAEPAILSLGPAIAPADASAKTP